MIVPFYVYSTSTGKISRTGVCPSTMVSVQAYNAGEAAGQGAVNPDTDTINTSTGLPNPAPGTLVPVTLSDLACVANGVDEALINGMLAGTVATWYDGVSTTIADGELRVTTDFAGSFSCLLSLPGYVSRSVVFTGA